VVDPLLPVAIKRHENGDGRILIAADAASTHPVLIPSHREERFAPLVHLIEASGAEPPLESQCLRAVKDSWVSGLLRTLVTPAVLLARK
jgi:hypothetical protein